MKKKQKIFNKLKNELNEQIQELTFRLKSLNSPPNPFVFFKSLDIVNLKKKITKKPEKFKSPNEVEKNAVRFLIIKHRTYFNGIKAWIIQSMRRKLKKIVFFFFPVKIAFNFVYQSSWANTRKRSSSSVLKPIEC